MNKSKQIHINRLQKIRAGLKETKQGLVQGGELECAEIIASSIVIFDHTYNFIMKRPDYDMHTITAIGNLYEYCTSMVRIVDSLLVNQQDTTL